MIKAIVFDAGGVLVDHGDQLSEFVKIFNPKNKDVFWENINHELPPLCNGKISEKEFWKTIARIENIDSNNIPDRLWERKYEETTNINNDLIEIIKKLKKNYKIIMLSNTIKSHVDINRKRGLFDEFDDLILSCEVKLSKGSDDIYQLVFSRNNLKPEECLFVDDIQKFIDQADSLGMKGILYKNNAQLLNEFEKFSVKVD